MCVLRIKQKTKGNGTVAARNMVDTGEWQRKRVGIDRDRHCSGANTIALNYGVPAVAHSTCSAVASADATSAETDTVTESCGTCVRVLLSPTGIAKINKLSPGARMT